MNKISGLSIRGRICLTVITVSLLALGALTAVLGFQVSQTLSEQASSNVQRTVGLKANEYDLVFTRLQEEAEAVADFVGKHLVLPEVPEDIGKPVMMPWVGEGTGVGFNNGYGSPELNTSLLDTSLKMQRIGLVLEGVESGNPYIELGYYASVEGLFVFGNDAAYDTIIALDGFEPAKRPWFRQAVLRRETIWTAPYVDANTKNLIVTVATPVFTGGQRAVGVVGFDVLLTTIQEDILTLDIGYEGSAFLVDQLGKALVREGIDRADKRWDKSFDTDNLAQTENSSFNQIVSSMMAQQSGIDEYESSEGTRLLAYAPVRAINASVGIQVTQSEVVKPAREMLIAVGIVAVVTAIVAILIGLVVGNGISKPIRNLTEKVDQISQGRGQLSSLPVDRRDEIGLLTQSFNRLITSLRIAITKRRKKAE